MIQHEINARKKECKEEGDGCKAVGEEEKEAKGMIEEIKEAFKSKGVKQGVQRYMEVVKRYTGAS
jgi:hypothetical protein